MAHPLDSGEVGDLDVRTNTVGEFEGRVRGGPGDGIDAALKAYDLLVAAHRAAGVFRVRAALVDREALIAGERATPRVEVGTNVNVCRSSSYGFGARFQRLRRRRGGQCPRFRLSAD
jgi:hypothetical protein